MTEEEYDLKIKQMKVLRDKLIHENSLASTEPPQVEANEWRIKWLTTSIERLKKPSEVEEEEEYVTFNPILDIIKNKGKKTFWSPNSLMSEKKS